MKEPIEQDVTGPLARLMRGNVTVILSPDKADAVQAALKIAGERHSCEDGECLVCAQGYVIAEQMEEARAYATQGGFAPVVALVDVPTDEPVDRKGMN